MSGQTSGLLICHQLLVATLNYRHTDEMIGKLESAGLGFYVKATETQQKLGKLKGNVMCSTLFVL